MSETKTATALKEDVFHTRDVIAELSKLPGFLASNERWLASVVAQLALKGCGYQELGGCGYQEIAYLLSLPVETLNEDLPSSFPEVGTSVLQLDFLPLGAVCRIQGSVSSAELNGKRCTVCRHLRSHESHALVEVEGDEDAGTVLLARKNLFFDSIGNTSAQVSVSEEELPAPGQLFSRDAIRPLQDEAERWLCGVVVRLLLKSCGKEEIGFILSLPAKGEETSFGTSSMPSSIGQEHMGMLLQDLSFCPSGAECCVEGSKSTGNTLNGLQGVLMEACPGHASHAKMRLPGEGEVLIHRKNLRLVAYATFRQQAEKESKVAGETAPSPGLCSWFGCCTLSKASKTTNAMVTHASVGGYSKTEATLTGELRRLADMKADGLLSDNEFHAAKAKLLAS